MLPTHPPLHLQADPSSPIDWRAHYARLYDSYTLARTSLSTTQRDAHTTSKFLRRQLRDAGTRYLGFEEAVCDEVQEMQAQIDAAEAEVQELRTQLEARDAEDGPAPEALDAEDGYGRQALEAEIWDLKAKLHEQEELGRLFLDDVDFEVQALQGQLAEARGAADVEEREALEAEVQEVVFQLQEREWGERRFREEVAVREGELEGEVERLKGVVAGLMRRGRGEG
ncbi:hypothetical protein MMC13_006964 [Lambiella insularis]|nr:hypothetical protein [Lambiella insularis]